MPKVPHRSKKAVSRAQILGLFGLKEALLLWHQGHMLVTASGQPTELAFSPASESDLNVLWRIELDLPTDAMIYADGVYTCFELEDFLKEDERIHLLSKKGKAVKQRRWNPDVQKKITSKQQMVETVFICITNLLPRAIIVRTQQGFWV